MGNFQLCDLFDYTLNRNDLPHIDSFDGYQDSIREDIFDKIEQFRVSDHMMRQKDTPHEFTEFDTLLKYNHYAYFNYLDLMKADWSKAETLKFMNENTCTEWSKHDVKGNSDYTDYHMSHDPTYISNKERNIEAVYEMKGSNLMKSALCLLLCPTRFETVPDIYTALVTYQLIHELIDNTIISLLPGNAMSLPLDVIRMLIKWI